MFLLDFDQFYLQRCPKTLHHCVVVKVASATHALLHTVLLKNISTCAACLLHAAITVMNKISQWLLALRGHRERVCRNLCMQCVNHAPPNLTSAPHIHLASGMGWLH